MSWIIAEDGHTINTVGSEHGNILRDEVYKDQCRITLEQDGYTPFGITCGIYGLMVHTAFAETKVEADEKYNNMKLELEKFVDSDDTVDVSEWCEEFTSKF